MTPPVIIVERATILSTACLAVIAATASPALADRTTIRIDGGANQAVVVMEQGGNSELQVESLDGGNRVVVRSGTNKAVIVVEQEPKDGASATERTEP